MQSKKSPVLIGAAIFIGVILLSVAVFFISNEWQRRTANYRGETAQIERTRANAGFRIQSYEWFFDHCAAIQTAEGQILVQEAELEGADEDRANRIETNLVALRNKRVALVNEYNQEARKEETTAQFRAADLPSYINLNDYETECGE